MKCVPLKILCMRVFLVVLMLALLPLQFSAAAVVECCDHLSVTQGLQTQHHQPAHLSVGPGTDERAGGEFDLDCGTCHANCAAAVTAIAAPTVVSAGIERVEHLAELILPPWYERPYRPQWLTPYGSGLNAYA